MLAAKQDIESQDGDSLVPFEVVLGSRGSSESGKNDGGARLRTLRSGIAMDIGPLVEGDAEDEAVNEAVVKLRSRYAYRFIKRLFDVVFSLFVLIAFSWLFLIIALAIKIDDSKGPVVFKQRRVAKDGKEFNMYKFRSMCTDAEERLTELKDLNEKSGPVFKIHDDPRVTRVGRVIRKLSFDETMQFVNVLKWI